MRVRLIPEHVPQQYEITDPDGRYLYGDAHGYYYIRMDQPVRCKTLPGQPTRMTHTIRVPEACVTFLWTPS
jgi:hypothetical protein